MSMFGELQFGRPQADPHFDPLGPNFKIWQNKWESEISIENAFLRYITWLCLGTFNLDGTWPTLAPPMGPNIKIWQNKLKIRFDIWGQGKRLKICQNKLKIRNQHLKCFPTIYNMTTFGELQFGWNLADPHFSTSHGPKYRNLAK